MGLLVFITLISIGLSATGLIFHQQSRREKEKQLLFAGDEIRRAIGAYYEQSPGGQKQFPQSLDDLLLDRRYASVQRYLRRIYVEPISGTKQWAPIRAPDGGIMGVHSAASGQPLRIDGFPPGYEHFKDKTSYGEWTFQYMVMDSGVSVDAPRDGTRSIPGALPSLDPIRRPTQPAPIIPDGRHGRGPNGL